MELNDLMKAIQDELRISEQKTAEVEELITYYAPDALLLPKRRRRPGTKAKREYATSLRKGLALVYNPIPTIQFRSIGRAMQLLKQGPTENRIDLPMAQFIFDPPAGYPDSIYTAIEKLKRAGIREYLIKLLFPLFNAELGRIFSERMCIGVYCTFQIFLEIHIAAYIANQEEDSTRAGEFCNLYTKGAWPLYLLQAKRKNIFFVITP